MEAIDLMFSGNFNSDEDYLKILEKAIAEMEKPIYTISKVDEFYLKNGFVNAIN